MPPASHRPSPAPRDFPVPAPTPPSRSRYPRRPGLGRESVCPPSPRRAGSWCSHGGSRASALRPLRRSSASPSRADLFPVPSGIWPLAEPPLEERAGVLPPARAQGGLQQRVVEDLALGVAAPHLDDPLIDRGDLRHRVLIIPAREGVQTLHERHHHLGERGVAGLLSSLAETAELRLRGAPVAGGGQGHPHVEIVEEEQGHLEPAPRRRAQTLPSPGIRAAVEIKAPSEGHPMLKARAHADRASAE